MNFEETLNKLQEKLGEENSAIIADDIASLLSYESARNEDMRAKDEEISKLNKSKEMLIEANGNLVQRIGAEKKEILENENEEEKTKKINIRDAFDKNGNFIK